MPFYNSRNSNFVMKFRRNCDIDLYFVNVLLQFPIHIVFSQGEMVSLRAPKIILIDDRLLRTLHRPPVAVAPTLGAVGLDKSWANGRSRTDRQSIACRYLGTNLRIILPRRSYIYWKIEKVTV